MSQIPEYIDGIVNIAGAESRVDQKIREAAHSPVFLGQTPVDFKSVKSTFGIALHMHQPLIPAGGDDMRTAAIIGNLQYMMEHQDIGDNHNAPVYHHCYKRMGEFIPQLVHEGKAPRVMLEYSGTLFHGLRQMGLDDVIDSLRTITCNPDYNKCVEWLGAPWGHPVAPSTPVQDFRLHIKAWQHHFAAIFGLEALGRVRGFSPSEMALPNHPDVAFAFVKSLRECGYQWVIVQEHSIENPETGSGPEQKHLPHRLVCTNSAGETASITAIIKTQGSDTKLIGQMQPYFEAKGLSRWQLSGREVPPLVTQIADGENGGVMMNEFPHKYLEVMRECSGSNTPAMTATEYLVQLFAMGITEEDLPRVQPLFQKQIWDICRPGDGPEKLEKAIETIKKEDHRFHMDGGSWTNDISWQRGYEDVLGPMEEVSALFYEKVIKPSRPTDENRYRNALFHLLCSQTSCYRYWGQGVWTDYGQEICRRLHDILTYDY